MPVFTILNCGTNFDRTKRGELIADFGAEMQGAEYQQFLITDGVGSKGSKLPGTFDPFTKDKSDKKKAPSWSKTPMQTLADVTQGEQTFSPTGHGVLRGVTSSTGNTHAAVTGDGWDDNIRHALAVIADVFPSLTGTINMVGWSRGAVTCLRMANWIREFLGDGFDVNIFAVDPVAGLDAGERLHDTYFIPSTVKNYVAILAMDEARGDFKPQDMSRMQVANILTTNVAFLPFPGVHNTVVVQKKSGLPEVTSVVRALAYKFLTYFGTGFATPEPTPTLAGMCKLYAAMMLKREQYAKLFKKGFVNKQMGGIVEREVASNVQSYVGADIHFFVNEHHRRCFELSWPQLYAYFFTGRMGAPGTMTSKTHLASSALGQELQQLSQSDAESFELLSTLYGVERKNAGGQPGMGTALWKTAGPGVGVAGIPAPPSSAAAVNALL
jgi:hypothetical protein